MHVTHSLSSWLKLPLLPQGGTLPVSLLLDTFNSVSSQALPVPQAAGNVDVRRLSASDLHRRAAARR